jgi:uncharacterized protein (PEP-CTERM system associated)
MVVTAATVTVFKLTYRRFLIHCGKTARNVSLLLGSSMAVAQSNVSPPTVPIPPADLPAIGGADIQNKKEEIKFLPGVRNTLTYSSNLSRTPGGSSGFVAEVAPYFEGAIDSERTKAQVYATLRGFFRTQGGSSVSPDLRSSGQTALFGDWLWISGSASIYTLAANPFAAVNFDPATANASGVTFRQLQLSPYIQGRFGTFADYQARYSLSTASSSSTAVLAKLDQRFSGSLKSGPQFNRWGWETTGEVQRRTFDAIPTQSRNSASGSIFAFPLPELRVGASVNFDQISNFSVNGKSSGTGLGLFADWTPSNRTSMTASAKKLYYGTVGKLGISHRFGFFTGALSYDKSVLTSSDASVLTVSPSSLFSAGGYSANLNPVFNQLAAQNLLQNYASFIGGGILSDFIILNNTLSASVGYASPVNSLVLLGTRSKRDTDATRAPSTFSFLSATAPTTLSAVNLSAFNTSSLSVDWIHTLDSKNSFGLRVSRTNLESIGQAIAPGKSISNLLQTTYRTKLTTDTSATFGIRHITQTGLGPATSFDETAIFGTLDVRF